MINLIRHISLGSFTNKDEFKKHPFWLLRENKAVLEDHKHLLLARLESVFYDPTMIRLFGDCFDYFIKNPKYYDGASGDVELHKVGNYTYDIGAIIHDYPDVTNFTTSIDLIKLVDRALIKTMEHIGDPDVHINKRKLVTLLAPVRFMLSRKRRKQQPTHVYQLESILTDYLGNYKIDYAPLYNYGIAILIVLILITTHPTIQFLIKWISLVY